ncbi:MAG: PDZ domain-containing protein [Actinophytocola sp.]|nr:PDZ domain-containing protein [Actinophytocola sp.]
MSENPHRPPNGGEPRLTPRPLDRGQVDRASAAAFGRPPGVTGAFDVGDRQETAARPGSQPASPPASLAEAFGPSEDDQGVVLQRPPGQQDLNGGRKATQEPMWASPADPWRNPGAPAVLGEPAVAEETEADEEEERPPAPPFSLSEVLFGGRLRVSALAVLVIGVLAVGALGGVLGWFIAREGNELHREVTLAQVQPGKERAPGSIAKVVAEVTPAVVSIEVTSGQRGGVGSGVVIDKDGYIVTNEHVIADATANDSFRLTVVFTDGTKADAKVVGSDPKTDLAVIKVNVQNPTVLQLGKSAELEPGDSVIAVGSPLGLKNTVTVGIVSALHRPVTAPGEGGGPPVTYDAIQTDAAINRGNSGGALVNKNGLLVGINSAIRTDPSADGTGGSIGLGFAIPVDDVVKITEALIRDGKVSHASIGVNGASVAAHASEGVRVQNVKPDGPAERAGIKEGDVIIKVADRTVSSAAELTVAVRQHEIGERVPITFVRDGAERVVDVKLGSD